VKVLLAQNATYVPVHGGAQKSNRRLVEGLAARGHPCCVVARAYTARGPEAHARFLERLSGEGAQVRSSLPGLVTFCRRGVEVHATVSRVQLRRYLVERIREFDPTWVLISSGGITQALLEAALDTCPSRVVYMARGTLELPFGPHSFATSERLAQSLCNMAAIVTTTGFLKGYIHEWGSLDATVLPLSLFGTGPFPRFGCPESGFVTMVNPCAYKGIAIFAALAERFPHVAFAAVPMWGTTDGDRATLEHLANVRLLPPVDDVDEIFCQTRVLLMPSLWGEGFGRIAVEAMLRGIPVLASNVGGIPEAKLGVDYLLPVRPIERYRDELDDRMLPIAVVPEQDVEPWVGALRELLSDRGHYERLSRESREAALAFVARLGGVDRLEAFLQGLTPRAQLDAGEALGAAQMRNEGEDGLCDRVAALSPGKRALLHRRIRARLAGPGNGREVVDGC
jgi:glycosyltransferase involved in cell wall biosynthesis